MRNSQIKNFFYFVSLGMKLAKNDIKRMQSQLYCLWRSDDFKKVSL